MPEKNTSGPSTIGDGMTYAEPETETKPEAKPKSKAAAPEAKASEPKYLSKEEIIRANEAAAAKAVREMATRPAPAVQFPEAPRPPKTSAQKPVKMYRVTEDRTVRRGASDITFRCGKILSPAEYNMEELRQLGVKYEEVKSPA